MTILNLKTKKVNTSGTNYSVTAKEVQSLWDKFYEENKDTLIQEGKKLFDTFEVEQGEELYDEPLCQTIKVYLTPDTKTDVGIIELGTDRFLIDGTRYSDKIPEFTEKVTLPLFVQFLRNNGYSCTTENLYSPLVTDVQLVKGDIEFPETPMSQKEINQIEEIKKFFDSFGIPIEYEGSIGNIYGSMKPAISGYLKNSILPLYLIISTGNKYSAEFQAEGTLFKNKESIFYEELQSRFTDKEVKNISKRWSKKLKPCRAISIEEAVSTLYSQLYDNLKDYIDLPEDYRKFLNQNIISSSKQTRLSKVLNKLNLSATKEVK